MIQKLLCLILPLFFLIFVSGAYAQTTTTNSAQATSDRTSKLKQQMQLLKDQKQTPVSMTKKEARIDLKQQIKERVQVKREEIKELVATKRQEFKAKLQIIKDNKKKALVERIDTKLSNVNTKHTDRFAQALSNLQVLLDKISLTATEKSVLADIATAQIAIDAAKFAVETQAAKIYTITISTESALRSDVGTVTSQLRQDLAATHKLVVDAKQAVQKLRTDNAIMKKEATSSANL